MPSIQTSIDIEATPERVWSVLADLSAYGRWNPVFTEARGWLAVGAPLDLSVLVGTQTRVIGARVLSAIPSEELRWRGPRSRLLGRVFSGEHYFLLTKTSEGCHLVHGEIFKGAASLLLIPPLRRQLERAYVALNVSLKKASESL